MMFLKYIDQRFYRPRTTEHAKHPGHDRTDVRVQIVQTRLDGRDRVTAASDQTFSDVANPCCQFVVRTLVEAEVVVAFELPVVDILAQILKRTQCVA